MSNSIERLTRTHADLDAELSKFAQLLRQLSTGDERTKALQALEDELGTLRHRVERHIASESNLASRSDRVLGEGAMDEYDIPGHHQTMRSAVEKLEALIRGDDAGLEEQFRRFVEHFEDYTKAEWEFLQTNNSVLYPGGASDG